MICNCNLKHWAFFPPSVIIISVSLGNLLVKFILVENKPKIKQENIFIFLKEQYTHRLIYLNGIIFVHQGVSVCMKSILSSSAWILI